MQKFDIYDRFMDDLVQFMTRYGLARAEEIEGCSEIELNELQAGLSVRLPGALAASYRNLGRKSGVRFMDGDDFGPSALSAARDVAVELTMDPDSSFQLPATAFPVMQHHGYVVVFVYLDAGDDPPVWTYTDSHKPPRVFAETSTTWLRESAIGAVERRLAGDENLREMRAHRERWLQTGSKGEYGATWLKRKAQLDAIQSEAAEIRYRIVLRVLENDRARGAITGPVEFQRLWNSEITKTDLYLRLQSQGKRIPWGWVDPVTC